MAINIYYSDLMDLCSEAVRALPRDVREYLASRFRRREAGILPSPEDSAMEVYRYAFFGEKPPRRYRNVIRPVIVALQLVGGGKGD